MYLSVIPVSELNVDMFVARWRKWFCCLWFCDFSSSGYWCHLHCGSYCTELLPLFRY